MDNQLAAQLLFNHQLATREQILECWPKVTPDQDIGLLLVQRGVLARTTYDQLLQHIRALAPEKVGSDPSWSPSPLPGSPAKPAAAAAPAPRPLASGTGKERPTSPVSASSEIGPDSAWEDLLRHARGQEASDLHLCTGNPILLRRFGSLKAVGDRPLEESDVRRWLETALSAGQLADFDSRGDLELVFEVDGCRYRTTLMKQRRGCDITVRLVPTRIRGFEESGLPESCRELTQWAQGMVLVTGPVGCGKSSTLSTLVEMVNRDRHDHIITLEDPIETVFEPKHCRITQRQLGSHTRSGEAALRAALREDPDIIMIAELRDLETIRLAVSAAETGHLVFGTMNTTGAGRTITRLVDSFPPEEQGVVRNMVSESLRGVISQQLLPRADGAGSVPAYEVLLVNTAVANMIRKDEIHQLGTAMLSGKSAGMVVLDDSLKALVEKGLVDPREAMARANSPKDFEKYLARGGH
ncbi:MAG TPA: PilT/PilU family type 4a pilus ATPase [Fibrobacteria bacterium]|nr:PilT/PilU family type 4a pilus ATPase [Fibrobacteria bacterium]